MIYCHNDVTSEAPFLPRDGRNHLRYSLHLPTEGRPGWVGLDKYRDGRPAKSGQQSQY